MQFDLQAQELRPIGKEQARETMAVLAKYKQGKANLEAQVVAGTPSHLLDRTYVAYFDRR